MKYITLMSYPSYFRTSTLDKNFFKIFFIDTTTIPNISRSEELSTFIKRDSYVYNTLSKQLNNTTESSSVIFMYQLFVELAKNISTYIDNAEEVEDMINLLKIAITKSDSQLSKICLLYTSPSPRDRTRSRMPSSA